MTKISRRGFILGSASALTASMGYADVSAKFPVTPEALETSQHPKHVIVIGAGLSGLVAAYELAAA
ncbi:MAG: hypothetical protein V7754_17345, partial [Halioglobus sp.]